MKYDYEVEYDSKTPFILKYRLVCHDPVINRSITLFDDQLIGTRYWNFKRMLGRVVEIIEFHESLSLSLKLRQKSLKSITFFNKDIELFKKYV